MRILISAAGSHGDVLPFIALGREFKARGHDVRFYTADFFEPLVQQAGLHFTGVVSTAEYETILGNPDVEKTFKGWKVLADGLSKGLANSYRAMAADIDPGNTVSVGSLLGFAARSLQEKHGVPAAVVHLAPIIFRSNHNIARMTELPPAQFLPGFVKNLLWIASDRFFLDPVVGSMVNRHRAEIGLPPVKRLFGDWMHQADQVIAMFPEWFADPQPDWPARLEFAGFPLYDHGGEQPLPPEVRAFLDAGDAPIGFTAGTGTAASRKFFEESVQACRLLGRRGILLTRHAGQVPASLPAGVARFDYVPFGALLPELAAFVHHGGIGTTSQALKAGVPQLVRPMAYDQFDNAWQLRRLGVAEELLPRRYRAGAAAEILARLLANDAMRANCAKAAQRLANDSPGAAKACDLILRCFAAGSGSN